MGLFQSKSIRVATANYSGITLSPFEFYSDHSKELSEELDRLNQIFKALYSQLNNIQVESLRGTVSKWSSEIKWNVKNIEKSLNRNRYCPQYRKDVGIENGKIMNTEKFLEKWEEQFNKNVRYVKYKQNKEEIQMCKIFDFLIFKTFVEYAYETSTGERKTQILDRDQDHSKASRQRRNSAKTTYQKFLQKYHSKPYLKMELKYKYLKKLIQNNDVVFLQDYSEQVINEIQNEGDITVIHQLQGDESCILIKAESRKFEKLYDIDKVMKGLEQDHKGRESPMMRSRFNYQKYKGDNKKCQQYYPAVCLTDSFLLMSVYFSSQKEVYQKQINAFMKHLIQIHKYYNQPQLQLQIIVGGDFNCDITKVNKESSVSKQFWLIFKAHPNQNNAPTTRKMRTWLQSQAHKAKILDETRRDFLISNSEFYNGHRVPNHNNFQGFLPTSQHPFDHFFIEASIKKA